MHSIQGKRYLDFGSFIKLTFGQRVQKIALDIGFTCPNRDGSKAYGGCTYCNNNSFNPNYCEPQKSITEQLQRGISFFAKKGKTKNFLAYFQAYTNTYSDIDTLKGMYEEALKVPQVVGLVIGTRPDCITDELIDYLDSLSKKVFVALEFGVESTNERTLIEVNRCHSFEDTKKTFERCKGLGFHLGAHLILGLPNESEEDLFDHADRLSELPIDTLKLHHLQIVRNSIMGVQYQRDPNQFRLFTPDTYIPFVAEFISRLRPDIIIERFISEAPQDLLIAPKWGMKNFEMVAKIDSYLAEHEIWQGKNYHLAKGR